MDAKLGSKIFKAQRCRLGCPSPAISGLGLMPPVRALGGNRCVLLLPRLNLSGSFHRRFHRKRVQCPLPEWNSYSVVHRRPWPVRSVSGGANDSYDVSEDAPSSASNDEGPVEKTGSVEANSLSTKEVLKKLKRYGMAGVLSYGLLNTGYYTITFLFVWFYVARVPGRMGYLAAVERFLKVMAMVWAGSQVTKLARAGGALALAPVVDRGLSWFTIKFKFESQGKAFMAIVWFCLGLALLLFVVVTLLWA